jgi:hypothetical protein
MSASVGWPLTGPLTQSTWPTGRPLWYTSVYTELGAFSILLFNFELKLIPGNSRNSINFEKSYKINRNSDENNLYIKNDQKNMKNPNM